MPTVELAHEALLREWPRLRDWIDEDREAIMVLGHLREAAASWVELGRDPGALYRGARLEVALDVANDRPGELPEPEREFLDIQPRTSATASSRQEAERVARQARANRRLRIQLAAIAVALVVALVGGFVALDQRGQARRNAAKRGERRVATARELAAAADANLADDPERSMLLALAAIDETRSSDGTVLPEAEQALHRAVTASRVVLSVPGVGGALDWSPDGTIFVTEGPEDIGPGRHPRRRHRRRRCARSTATTSTSTTSPSAATVRCSPPPVTTAPSASGIPPPATSCSSSRTRRHERP